MRMMSVRAIASMAATLVCGGTLVMAGGAQAQPGQSVNTFPIPGSHVASPYAQIAFRGVPAYVVVQALDAQHHVLGTSAPAKAS